MNGSITLSVPIVVVAMSDAIQAFGYEEVGMYHSVGSILQTLRLNRLTSIKSRRCKVSYASKDKEGSSKRRESA